MQDERILRDILNILVNFILNILIKRILIKKRVGVGFGRQFEFPCASVY